jgi:hypothetical protein
MYEFADCEGDPMDLAMENCHTILAQNNVQSSNDDAWWYWMAMLAILVTFRGTALLVLQHKGATF